MYDKLKRRNERQSCGKLTKSADRRQNLRNSRQTKAAADRLRVTAPEGGSTPTNTPPCSLLRHRGCREYTMVVCDQAVSEASISGEASSTDPPDPEILRDYQSQ